jgi:hypothetical protein
VGGTVKGDAHRRREAMSDLLDRLRALAGWHERQASHGDDAHIHILSQAHARDAATIREAVERLQPAQTPRDVQQMAARLRQRAATEPAQASTLRALLNDAAAMLDPVRADTDMDAVADAFIAGKEPPPDAMARIKAEVRADPPAQTPDKPTRTGPKCINCGEANDGGYITGEGEVGPFCSMCWQYLIDELRAQEGVGMTALGVMVSGIGLIVFVAVCVVGVIYLAQKVIYAIEDRGAQKQYQADLQRLISISWWFSEDDATRELVRDLGIGVSAEIVRDNWRKARALHARREV